MALLRPWLVGFLFAIVFGAAQAQTFDYGPQPFGPHKTEERWGTYDSPAAEGQVRYFMVKPSGSRAWPGIYYVYGRPGLDHRLLPELRRLASYGFTVFVSHFQEALLIPILLPGTDPAETLQVQIEGYEAFLKMPERRPGSLCVASTVRGGIYGSILATRPESACYLGLHTVLLDHGWHEYKQDVTILPTLRKLATPTLLMVGEKDFEARTNQSKRATNYLRSKGVPVELVIYPGASRGFDFRIAGRTLADDMAKIDSMNRAVAFLNRYLNSPSAIPNTTPRASAPLPERTRIVSQGGVEMSRTATSSMGGD